jgi:LPPG:FO 2-phospho-L-lactate transferase
VRCILESYPPHGNHRVTLLAGGVGGAKMALALRGVLDPGSLTVVVNVGDDTERYGVHVSADPDTVLYTLAGVVGPPGWGRAGDTSAVMAELARHGIDTPFMLGDVDLGLCLARTMMLRSGMPLSVVTERLSASFGLTDVRIIPASDDDVRTWVQIDDGSWIDFQSYFVDRGHADSVRAVAYHGSVDAQPAPGVIEAIESADVLVVAPSNPPLSIWPILAVDAIDEAVATHPRRIAVSPLFGGAPLKGPADEVMIGVGLPPGTAGVLEAYRGRIDALVVDESDEADTALGTQFGVDVITAPTRIDGGGGGAILASRVLGWAP